MFVFLSFHHRSCCCFFFFSSLLLVFKYIATPDVWLKIDTLNLQYLRIRCSVFLFSASLRWYWKRKSNLKVYYFIGKIIIGPIYKRKFIVYLFQFYLGINIWEKKKKSIIIWTWEFNYSAHNIFRVLLFSFCRNTHGTLHSAQ